MHDTESRRHDTESIEGLHSPFHELVTFPITIEFQFHVEVKSVFAAQIIDLDRVIDDQINRNQRFNFFRIFSGTNRHISHGCQIDKQWNSRKVLQDDAGNDKRNFITAFFFGFPVRKLTNVFFRDFLAVTIAEN